MNYRQMVEAAVKGGAGDKAMWASVDVTSELMEQLEHKHPDIYGHYMRKAHEAIYGKHYNRYFAEEDVEKLHYTDKDGKEHHGGYWTIEQIKEATAENKFPAGTTDWDKYVAYNAAYADFSKKFEDGDILCIAWLFYFADEDWKGDTKVWDYMSMNK